MRPVKIFSEKDVQLQDFSTGIRVQGSEVGGLGSGVRGQGSRVWFQ